MSDCSYTYCLLLVPKPPCIYLEQLSWEACEVKHLTKEKQKSSKEMHSKTQKTHIPLSTYPGKRVDWATLS